jgi:hypothetical protein
LITVAKPRKPSRSEHHVPLVYAGVSRASAEVSVE